MTKRTFLLLMLALLLPSIFFGQIETNNAGARSAGMANASVTNRDVWATFNNPAAVCQQKGIGLGLYYENRFLMKETGFGAVAFQMPLSATGNIQASMCHYGYKSYNYNKLAVGYAQQLFSNFFMGINLDYYHVGQADDYGDLNALTFELGVLAVPVKNFSVGLYVFNPISISTFEDGSVKLPVTMRLGLSYLFGNSLLLAVETGTSINGYTSIFKTGIEYTFKNRLSLRAGISMLPVEYSFGVGYEIKKFAFDLAYSYHQVLGSSPKISVRYDF